MSTSRTNEISSPFNVPMNRIVRVPSGLFRPEADGDGGKSCAHI
jgi:hypothetical protein